MQPKFDTIFAKKVRKNASKPTGKSYLKKRGMKKERNVTLGNGKRKTSSAIQQIRAAHMEQIPEESATFSNSKSLILLNS